MYTQADYDALLAQLAALGSEQYRKFNEKLIPGMGEAYGVRIPELRRMGARIAKEDGAGFLRFARDDTHEELLLQGVVIGKLRCMEAQRMAYLRDFVPKIKNWAICDCTCSSIKAPKKYPEEYWAFIAPYLSSPNEYEVRFGVVMLLWCYLTPEWVDAAHRALLQVSHEGYYARMAVAWALAESYTKFRDKTLQLLRTCDLDAFTYNMTIRKCCDSFRVADADKQMLRSMIHPAT